jgi:CheY-like chemotaxis protein
MNGSITAKSNIGDGSTFTITVQLPISHDGQIEENSEYKENKFLEKKHILVVEDNEINQLIIEDILQNFGAKVSITNDGEEALRTLEKETFDMILMDIQMPVMDGFQATKKIRSQSQFNDIPIIAMTANAMEGDRNKCLNVGMNDHIAKPLDVNQIADTMSRHL